VQQPGQVDAAGGEQRGEHDLCGDDQHPVVFCDERESAHGADRGCRRGRAGSVEV